MVKDGQGTGDQVQSEMLAAVARYRSLEGERMFNHFLRNMLLQSNSLLREHGLVVADDQRAADLETQLHKARSEAAAAAAYANWFGASLRKISLRKDISTSLEQVVREALEWHPQSGEKVIAKDGEAERATH